MKNYYVYTIDEKTVKTFRNTLTYLSIVLTVIMVLLLIDIMIKVYKPEPIYAMSNGVNITHVGSRPVYGGTLNVKVVK